MAGLDAARESVAERFIFERSNDVLADHGQPPVKGRSALGDLLRRPNMNLVALDRIIADLGEDSPWPIADEEPGSLANQIRQQLEIEAIYSGYLKRQSDEVALALRLNEMAIPSDLDYHTVGGLSYESTEKLGRIRPLTIGQAGRVPGVRPTDIALLIGHLRRTPVSV